MLSIQVERLERRVAKLEAIVAQSRPEAPATSCRGCNHERHPSLSCGERDGARNELAEAKRERADYGDKMTARTGELENELATLRAKVDELESGARVARLVEANRQLKAKVERRTGLVEQALEGRRSNWTLSHWFDWEHTALAELATAQPAVCPKCGYPKEPTGDPQTHRLCDCPNDQPAEAQETRKP